MIMMQLSAERKSDTGKENISQEANSGRKSSKKKQNGSVLLRPVSTILPCTIFHLIFVMI